MTNTSIHNIGEYYSPHYLESAFSEDIKKLFTEKEEFLKASEKLRGSSEIYFEAKEEAISKKDKKGNKVISLENRIFSVLGFENLSYLQYEFPSEKTYISLRGMVERLGSPYLALLTSNRFFLREENCLELPFVSENVGSEEWKPAKFSTLSKAVLHIFSREGSPRWVICYCGSSLYLFDKYSFFEGKYLEIDLDDAFGRKETIVFREITALLHHSSFIVEGEVFHDRLEDNSHKYAFGVTSKLQNAVREAIELLGNDWVNYRKSKKLSSQKLSEKEKLDLGEDLSAERLKHEALVYIYRILFCLYAEAREDSGLLPMKSEEYRFGYSLESLRDLELVPLNIETINGTYFHEHLKKLFSLVQNGFPTNADNMLGILIKDFPFELPALTSSLFNPSETFLLDHAELTNETLQKVIVRLSLSESMKGKGRGRINYAELGISQLGAVYEGLLSYSAIFADTDLIHVGPKDCHFEDSSIQTWFVPKSRIKDFSVEEVEQRGTGARIYPEGSFLLYLSHVDRERTASFYTPEVLTKCLVEEAIEELLKEVHSADEILQLKLCEPAMGSGAILHEAVGQLATKYLEAKQKEIGKSINPEDFQSEWKKVKYYITTRNAYGVDLNPMAVELGSLSLWLGTQFRILEEKEFLSPVPWFGLRLRSGNSLIGARRAVWTFEEIKSKKHLKDDSSPRLLAPGEKRMKNELYHFLVFDPDMAPIASDALAKEYFPDECKEMKEWLEKEVKSLWEDGDIKSAMEISEKIDLLWEEYSKDRLEALKKTDPVLHLWPNHYSYENPLDITTKEEVKEKLESSSGAFQRLKLLMDVWCGLYFVDGLATNGTNEHEYGDKGKDKNDKNPFVNIRAIRGSKNLEEGLATNDEEGLATNDTNEHEFKKDKNEKKPFVNIRVIRGSKNLLPTRRAFLVVAQVLVGGGVDQDALNFLSMETGFDLRRLQSLTSTKEIDTDKLSQVVSWLDSSKEKADSTKFHHWELVFPEVLGPNPIRNGFDFILGNPPWLKQEWQEAAVLNGIDPILGVRGGKSADYNKERKKILSKNQTYYFQELTRNAGESAFLNSARNYVLLKKIQTNLYKNFLVKSWELLTPKGVGALLHPTNVFDDPNGGKLREEYYPRLKKHFQFVNEIQLFADVGHQATYSINIYLGLKNKISPNCIFNLFHPKTILESNNTFNRSTNVPGIKTQDGNWELKGHPDRMVLITEKELKVLYDLFGGESLLSTKLPQIHARPLLEVLEIVGKADKTIGDLKEESFSTEMYHESNAQRDGILQRQEKPSFQPKKPDELVLVGPLVFVGNPVYGSAYTNCTEKAHFERIDLTEISETFLPRSPYKPLRKEPFLVTMGNKKVDVKEFYRIAWRSMAAISGERTLMSVLIPKGASHINGVSNAYLKNHTITTQLVGLLSSLVIDFLIRFTGVSNVKISNLSFIPQITNDTINQLIVHRALRLNCLTSFYAELWEELSIGIQKDSFFLEDDRLVFAFESPWKKLNGGKKEAKWDWHSPLRSDFARRLAMLELDVLVAKGFGLSLSHLQLIYELQFPVLQQYERVDEYDSRGRRLPNTSRKDPGGKEMREARKQREENIESGKQKVSDPIEITYPIDGGTRTTKKVFYPPFSKVDRVWEYEKIWAEMEKRI